MSLPKKIMKSCLAAYGYEVKPLKRRAQPKARDLLLDDPREAFIEPNHRYPYSFKANLDLVVDHQAFGFGTAGWHPFIAALKETQGDCERLQAAMAAFYNTFKPTNAKEAIIGFKNAPKVFGRLPPHAFYLTPWSNKTPEDVTKFVETWVALDNTEHGVEMTLAEGGFQSYGPVSEKKLRLETKRLSRTYLSLRSKGYDRALGECKFLVVRLGHDIRLIAHGGGYHRTACAAALSLSYVPGDFHPARLILDVDDVDLWPNVRSGLWSRKQAVSYVEHLFYFDGGKWARSAGLHR